MPAHPRLLSDPRIVQRAIVHQLLRDDLSQAWSREQVYEALGDAAVNAIDDALASLEAKGAIYRLEDLFGAANCTRHLFSLGLIAV